MSGSANDQGTSVLEQYTIEQIPESERHGRPRDLFFVWFASNIMPLTIITGALAAAVFGLSFWWSVVAIVVGNLAGGLFMALHSAQGPRLGVPQMIQSRAQFGVVGATLVIILSILMYVGFFASNLILGGLFTHSFASGISVNWGIVLSAIGSLVITIVGYDLIHAVNRYASWVFGGAMLLTFILAVARGLPSDFFSAGGFSGGPFLAMLSIAALWQIAYAPYVSDYSRYMPSDEGVRPTFWMSYWGCTIGSILPMVLGVVVALAVSGDTTAGIHTIGGGAAWLILLIFALGIIDTNVLNVYSALLCLITVGQTFSHRWLPGAGARTVTATGMIGVSLILALAFQSNFLNNYVNFILLLLYVLIPWTAINLVDYYLIRKGDYNVSAFFERTGGIYGRMNWVGLSVYLVGIVVEIPFVNTTLYQGPVSKALNGADLAWLVGLAVTIPLYYFAAKRFAAGPMVAVRTVPVDVGGPHA